MYCFTRHALAAAVISASLCAASARAASPEAPASAPSPTTEPAADPQIEDAILRLGDPDPHMRDEAAKLLWSRGRAAQPALKRATEGPDPEIARRAASILRDFNYGLYPDAPREVFALLEQYRKGDLQLRRAAISGLSTRGTPGLRVLLRLSHEERDESLRLAINGFVAARGHEAAVLMLADGDTAGAQQLLEKSAPDSQTAAQDYAALMLCTGKLNQALVKVRIDPLHVRNAALLVAVSRAAGDLASARAAAEKSTSPELLESVLIEQGDWKTLAERAEINPQRLEPVEQLGFLCAFYRLAGDQPNYDRMVKRLIARAQQVPGDLNNCVENLCLNDRPDDAVRLLIQQEDYSAASNFLAPRLQFREAIGLADRARGKQPAEVLNLKARSIAALHFMGEIEKAKQTLDGVATENRVGNDFSTWVYLVDGARLLGLKDLAEDFCVTAIDTAKARDQLPWLFEKMRMGDGTAAVRWWLFLRQTHPQDGTRANLRRLRSVYEQTITDPQLDQLLARAQEYEAQLSDLERENWIATVADTLAGLGRVDLAGRWYDRLAEGTTNPHWLIHVGDFEASRKRWDAAADYYDRVWQRNPTDAAALFLKGWATIQAGRVAEGRTMTELAHELPLGSESARHALLDVLLRHHLSDDIRRECELIIKTTAPRSWEKNDALRRLAEDAASRGQELAAADMWERAFLDNEGNSVSFMEPWANVIVPALIHRTRALGLIKAGRTAEGVKEAQMSLDECPADADVLIDAVTALDHAGHKPEADALFRRQTDVYRKLIADFPRSGPAHNQLAWAQVKCGRELDDALMNAKRAVELEPTSTASIDTLAEVYFARGDAPHAIEQIKRCIELEPKVERHRRQLERFEHPTTAPAAQNP